jgi:hypothetical protein
VPVEDIMVHTAVPVRGTSPGDDPDEWAQGEPDAEDVRGAPFDCCLFLPLGTESPGTAGGSRTRSVRTPTLLYLPERADGSAVALSHDLELVVVAAELNLTEGLPADAEVRYQVDGTPQPAGRPGEDVIVVQAHLTRIDEAGNDEEVADAPLP